MHSPSYVRRWLAWAGLFTAALTGAALGIFLVLPLGLVLPGFVVMPLALFEGALLATVGAGLAGAWLLRDDGRPALLAVVATTLTVAAVIALTVFGIPALAALVEGPLAGPGVASSLILGCSAAAAAWRFRGVVNDHIRERYLIGAALVVSVLSIPMVVGVAALFGLAGA